MDQLVFDQLTKPANLDALERAPAGRRYVKMEMR